MTDYMKNQGLVDAATGARNRQRKLEQRIAKLEKVLERIAEYPYDRSFDPLAVMNLTGMAREAIAAAEGDDARECPTCGEITLLPTHDNMWSCTECKTEAQFRED